MHFPVNTRRKGTSAFSVSAGDAVAIAKTSPGSNGRAVVEPDAAYKAWVAEEPADFESPAWAAWMDRWPG